jgi:mono/diheme cytochrome c family protein
MPKLYAWAACLTAAFSASVVFPTTAAADNFSQVERGRYLATVADSTACHTLPGSDHAVAGGRAIETPIGQLVAPNITPDAETGIGAWTDDQFDQALRRGRRPDGSRLYPAMPFNYYTMMTRDDVLAIRVYLATVPSTRNAVQSNTLPFPFRVRAVMRAWDAIYFREGEYRDDPTHPSDWNRGAYLVQGPGHCGACHTPKSLLGGDKRAEYLQGAKLQGWFAPDITGSSGTGLGTWSLEDVTAYLKTGHNRISAATGPMAEEVALSSAHMTDADLRAIATYLKSVPGVDAGRAAVAATDATMIAGGAIYRDQCSACHGLEGRGVPQLFPSLADSSVVRSTDATTSIRIVLRGARSVGTAGEPTSPGMPSYGRQLDDQQIAAVLTYVRNAWGVAASVVSTNTVSQARSSLAARAD